MERHRERRSGGRTLIPQADIVAWRSVAPWITDAQVEQDLILSRALVEVFSSEFLSGSVALRGGTALHKLYLAPARRYSEDIDLVQVTAGAIGPILDAVHDLMDGLLGRPRRDQAEDSVTLTYRTQSEMPPVMPLRLKIEVNTREHFDVLGLERFPFSVESRWFIGKCKVTTYGINELLATKLRALYQRKKGRDLFDLWLGITAGGAEPVTIVEAFRKYVKAEGSRICQKEFRANLAAKMKSRAFLGDIEALLRPGVGYDHRAAYEFVDRELIGLL